MISVIGFKRLIILVVLLSINIALGAGTYMYLAPEQQKTEKQLRTVRTKLSNVKYDLERMQVEFEQLDQQQDRFDKLKEDGFFSNQVRSTAKDLFSLIQDRSNVISAKVSVKSGVIEDNKDAQKSKHKVLKSLIDIEIKAFDDADVYAYLSLVLNKFPGHVAVDNVTIKRVKDISSPVLRAIKSGANPELINASLVLSWRTLIPEDQVLSETDGR